MTSLDLDEPLGIYSFPFETWAEYFAAGLAASTAHVYGDREISLLQSIKGRHLVIEATRDLQAALEKYADRIVAIIEEETIND
jgi:hypothetical protein